LISYIPWLCWIAPALGAALIPFFGIFKRLRNLRGYFAISTITLSVLFSFLMLPEVIQGRIIDLRLQISPPIEIGLLVDPLSALMAILVSVIGLFVAIFSHGFVGEDSSLTRFWFIMQLFISGYLIIVLANNLLFMFIGWEIVGLSVTYLTSFEYRKRKKANLGLKVNSILRVGDIALLFFILMVYAYAGTFNFLELSKNSSWLYELSRSGLLLFSSLMFFGGIIGKSAQFPLQEWLPDMLVGTPSSTNALTEVLAGPYLMVRALPIFQSAYISGFNELSLFFLIVSWIGTITALLSALMATVQSHPQRIMAYSISSIVGLMITASGLAGINRNMISGYLATTTIITIDAFVSALLILSTVIVSYALYSEDVFHMRGLKNKLTHNGMEIAIFAMINVPPFSGFWLSNWVQSLALEISEKALELKDMLFVYSGYGIFILLILTGGITAFYGIRLLGLIFKKGSQKIKVRGIPFSMQLSFAFILGITMLLDFTVPILIPLLNNYFYPILGEIIFENVFDVILYIIPSISTIMTLIALIIFGYISYQIYISDKIDLKYVFKRYNFLTRIHYILLNRFYIDMLYSKIVSEIRILSKKLYRNIEMEGIKSFKIKGINEFFDIIILWFSSTASMLYSLIEMGGFDKLNRKVSKIVSSTASMLYSLIEMGGFDKLNKKIKKSMTSFSESVQEMQTGVLSYNVLIMLIGAVLIAIMLLVFGGLLKI
jgi:NADH-quinone oxidoreductase subunit L